MYPKLRFKGFDDAWEQRKLSDIGNIITGSTPSTKDKNNYNGDFLFVSPADIQGNRFVEKTITTLSELGFKKGRILAPKSTLFVSIGSTIGKVAQIRDFAVTNQQINSIEPFKDIDPDFVFSLMQKESPSIRCLSATQAVPILNKTTFSNVEVSIASNINEQYRIGELFIKLDSTITLHQRQCETLKKQKQFFLQNMFPKEGESSPKIRFKGFSDSWKQCKLHEICSMNARIGWQNLRTSEFLDSGDYLLITGTDFVNGKVNFKSCHYVDKYRFDQDLKIQVQNGSILITKDGTLGKVAIIESLPKPATLNAGVFNVVIKSKDIDNYYLYQYLKAPFLMNYVNKRSTGGTIKHLNQSILVDFPVLKPSLQEQQKIGAYFERLDNLITLHQRQYEQLVSLKKYLLTKMFI